jgi:hypothetical protein
MHYKTNDDPEKVEVDYYNLAEELLERFSKIYSPSGDDSYQATCSRCGATTVLHHMDLPSTHCPECSCCLYCGSEVIDDNDAACCDWPMGFTMSYHPDVVDVTRGGADVPATSSF